MERTGEQSSALIPLLNGILFCLLCSLQQTKIANKQAHTHGLSDGEPSNAEMAPLPLASLRLWETHTGACVT